jgi:hypothetical protein
MGVNSHTVVDPIAGWLRLMEVVQMLCPIWPVREHGMRGKVPVARLIAGETTEKSGQSESLGTASLIGQV